MKWLMYNCKKHSCSCKCVYLKELKSQVKGMILDLSVKTIHDKIKINI